MFGGFGGRRGANRNRPTKGADSLVKVRLTFEEAVFGCKKSINIDLDSECEDCSGKGGSGEQTCSTCGGRGRVVSQQRTMFGVFQSETTCPDCGGKGKTFKEKCKKCNGTGHSIKNNIYLEFRVKEHPLFERKGNDIYLDVPLTITEAVLGCKKEIPTLDGNVVLTIDAGTQSGDQLRLKGKGVKDPNRSKKGDMYVIIDVVIPSKLDRKQKELFNELSKTKFSKIKVLSNNLYKIQGLSTLFFNAFIGILIRENR